MWGPLTTLGRDTTQEIVDSALGLPERILEAANSSAWENPMEAGLKLQLKAREMAALKLLAPVKVARE